MNSIENLKNYIPSNRQKDNSLKSSILDDYKEQDVPANYEDVLELGIFSGLLDSDEPIGSGYVDLTESIDDKDPYIKSIREHVARVRALTNTLTSNGSKEYTTIRYEYADVQLALGLDSVPLVDFLTAHAANDPTIFIEGFSNCKSFQTLKGSKYNPAGYIFTDGTFGDSTTNKGLNISNATYVAWISKHWGFTPEKGESYISYHLMTSLKRPEVRQQMKQSGINVANIKF